MKNIHSLILLACAALMLATIPTGTVTCKRDIVPDGSIELQGLPGGAQIKSGGGKTVISLPAVSQVIFERVSAPDLIGSTPSMVATAAEEWRANLPVSHPSGFTRVAWTDPDLLKRPLAAAVDRHSNDFTTSTTQGRVCHRGV